MRDRISVSILMLAAAAGIATAGVAYHDPLQGWAYVYDGVGVATPNGAALDGTWDHDNGSDEWDATAIGEGNPGGVSALADGSTTFIRIQDAGDPRDYGFPATSSQKIMFTHNINNDIGAAGDTILTNGVTLSFRARVATGAPLDRQYPNGGGGIVDWPAGGDGTTVNSDGKGNFSVRQNSGDSIITFSLAVASDHTALGGKNGLVMNNLNGTSATANVDTGEAGTLNLLEVPTITEWHEFWITIQPDTTGGGTHKVLIYMDGSQTPATFHVTAGTGNDESWNYIAMGSNMTDHSAAYDIDFFAYAAGIIPPPEPTFNPAPVVDAEPDGLAVVRPGEPLQLNATVTDEDPMEGEPGTLSYEWTKASGPGTVTFSNATILNPTATFSAAGDYELMLVASDGDKDANDVVKVWVKDRATELLLARYPLNGNALDATSGGRNLKLLGDTTYAPGAIGQAASFDGAGDSMVQTDPNFAVGKLLNGGSGISVSCWIKSDVYDTDRGFVIFHEPAGTDNMDIRYDEQGATGSGDAVLKLGVSTTAGILQAETSNESQTTNWQHVVMTWERGSPVRCYIDGIEETYTAQNAAVDATLTNFESLILGRGGKDNDPNAHLKGWDGLIDEVRIYNYALPLEDLPEYDSVRKLAAMGPIVSRVDAGADIDFNWRPGLKAELNGSVVDYGRQDPRTIEWSMETGPAQAQFDNAASPVTMVSFPTSGQYVLKLTVDDNGMIVEDTLTANVNAPTCADALADGRVLIGDIGGPDGKGPQYRDCRVDFYDFMLMAQDWLLCNDPAVVECLYPYGEN